MKAVSSEWDKRVALQWDSSSAMVVLLEEHPGTHSALIEAPRAAASTRAPLMTALSLEKQICWFFLHFLMDKRSRHSSVCHTRLQICALFYWSSSTFSMLPLNPTRTIELALSNSQCIEMTQRNLLSFEGV